MRIKPFWSAALVVATAPFVMAPGHNICRGCTIRPKSPGTTQHLQLTGESVWRELRVAHDGRYYVDVSVDEGAAEVEVVSLSPAPRSRSCDGDDLDTFCEFDAAVGARIGVSIIPSRPGVEVTIRSGTLSGGAAL